ncbi:MAG: hypothetical protein K0S55_479 [Clostridia bacterium]|nr:hypothetical protein [Clostridia bacterium]
MKLPADNILFDKNLALKGENGEIIPIQITSIDGKKYMVFIISLKKGTEMTFKLVNDYESCSKTELIHKPELKCMDIILNNKLFTSYVYDDKFAKPYLGPVYNREGGSYTRLDFETKEHPHQRSVFLGIGDVNGIDFWNEPENMGLQIHKGFENIEEGPVFAAFTAENLWCDITKKAVMRETRRIIIYNQTEENRFIDFEFSFFAEYEDIVFGATKEAGPLGIRMNELLKVDISGIITNSYGGVNEEECWGKPAQWCDYSGNLNGKDYGISIFDNPGNERFPTCWHIRNYGLFAANNLYFKGGFNIKKGEKITYKYRICFHEGNAKNSEITDKYMNYINF